MEPIAGVSFSPARLHIIADAGEGHFWHEPRRELILQLLGECSAKDAGALLDVGCGTGALVRALLSLDYDARGIDPFARESGLNEPSFTTGTLAHLPWEDASFATLCAFDVLEHVDEDAALREMMRVLRPGGRMLISVPAYQALWGPRDDAAGHLRRYSRRMLRATLTRHGLVVERLFGFQLELMPLLLVSRDQRFDIGRVKPDGRLVEHEQRVVERRAERGGERDALAFAARQRARLAVERHVPEPDALEVAETRQKFAPRELTLPGAGA
jgi:SAM-dependent methyltransferase